MPEGQVFRIVAGHRLCESIVAVVPVRGIREQEMAAIMAGTQIAHREIRAVERGPEAWRHKVGRLGSGLDVECSQQELTGELFRINLAGAILWSVSSGPQLMRRTRAHAGFAFGPTALIQLSGTMRFIQGHHHRELTSGSFVFLDIASPHEIEYTDDFEILALQFPVNTFQRGAYNRALGKPMSGADPMNAPFFQCALNLRNVANDIHPTRHSSALAALVALSHLTSAISGADDEPPLPVRMVRAMQFIEKTLGDPDLSAQRVADAQGVSRRYLDALFSSHGHRVQTWIWERRLQRAAEDLRLNTEWRHTILQSALDHGFKTPSHFSRAFAKRFGVSPREYRKQKGIAN